MNRKNIVRLLILPLAALMAFCGWKQAEKKLKVSLKVTQTRQYCGGARLPKHMEEEYNTPKPLAGKKVYIRKGKENSESKPITATSDAGGNLSVKLSPGTYCVVDESRLKNQVPADSKDFKYDPACYKEWFKGCDLVIEVTPKTTSFEVNFFEACYFNKPCAEFKGALPN